MIVSSMFSPDHTRHVDLVLCTEMHISSIEAHKMYARGVERCVLVVHMPY